MPPRRLTEDQQQIALQALEQVRPAIAGFLRQHPSMRRASRLSDLESIANMAVVRGAFSYDPQKGAIATYFGTVIKRALVKEVAKTQKNMAREESRAGLEYVVRDRKLSKHQLLAALRQMPMKYRHLIEDRYLSRYTIQTLADAYGINRHTMAKRLHRALDMLWELAADLP